MGEFVSKHDLAVADLAPSTAINVDIPIPVGADRWTILVTPRHKGAGSPPDPTVQVQYLIGGEFFVTNPSGAPVPAALNKANIITREDVVNRVRLVVTPGASPLPDNGIKIRLSMSR